MDERDAFLPMFLAHGISAQELHRMSFEEVQMTVNGFLDENSRPSPSRSPSVPRPRSTFYEELLAYQRNFDDDTAMRLMQERSRGDKGPCVDARDARAIKRSASVAPRPNPKPTPLPKPAPKPAPKRPVDPVRAAVNPCIRKRANPQVEPVVGNARPGAGPSRTPIGGARRQVSRPPGVTSRPPKVSGLERPEDTVRIRHMPSRKPDTMAVSRPGREPARPAPKSKPVDCVRGLEERRAQERKEKAATRKQQWDQHLQELDDELEEAKRRSLADARAGGMIPAFGQDEDELIEEAKRRSLADARAGGMIPASGQDEDDLIEKVKKESLRDVRGSRQPARVPNPTPPARVADPTPTRPKSDADTEAARALTRSQAIRKEQDDEYQNAVIEQQQRDREEEEQRRREEEEQRRQEQQQLNREDELQSKFRALPAEPKDGIVLACNLNGKRIQRRFDPHAKGEMVYVWVAGQTLESNEKLFLDSFDLKRQINGAVISKEEPLDDQGVKGREMVVIDVL